MAKRIIVGVLLILLYVAIVLFENGLRTAVLTAAAVIAAYEMGTMFKNKGYAPCMIPSYVFAVLHYAMMARFGYGPVLLIWFLCLIATAAERIFSKSRTTEDMMLGMVLLCYPMMLFMALAMVASGAVVSEGGSVGLILLLASSQLTDTMAFFVGSIAGKHKLCPHISPNKTVEGAVGGFIGGAAGALVAYFMQRLWGLSLGFWPMLAAGLVCSAVGQIGDLVASLLKRWSGIKDYGWIFPGHGGVMDRIDSLLMCAPVVLAYLLLAVA